ncbi:MAG: hypothetical protein Tsb0021_16240 [Chlamydiales bacterium]
MNVSFYGTETEVSFNQINQMTFIGKKFHVLTSSEQKIHIHYTNSLWSNFTMKIRENLFSHRWQATYLKFNEGGIQRDIKILISMKSLRSKAPLLEEKERSGIYSCLGKSLALLKLRDQCKILFFQTERFDLIRIPNRLSPIQSRRKIAVKNLIGKDFSGATQGDDTTAYCHIFRIKNSPLNFIGFFFRKWVQFRDWEEVSLQSEEFFERILIKKSDKIHFESAGLI